MIQIKSKEDIEQQRISALKVGDTLAEVSKYIKPGVTTAYLDKIAEQYILDMGGVHTF